MCWTTNFSVNVLYQDRIHEDHDEYGNWNTEISQRSPCLEQQKSRTANQSKSKAMEYALKRTYMYVRWIDIQNVFKWTSDTRC